MTPAEAIEAAELTEAEIRYRHQVAREMYERGRAAGWREGYAAAEADDAAAWARVCRGEGGSRNAISRASSHSTTAPSASENWQFSWSGRERTMIASQGKCRRPNVG